MKKILFLKKAFTLAEVLITLAVIGVIAAATIPIVKSYQKQQYVAGLKKAYSQMSQMLKQYMAEENVSSLEQSALFAQPYNYTELDKLITKYFKTAKVCKLGNNSCRITESYLGIPASEIWFNGDYQYSFCTADGMCFCIEFYSSPDCAPKSIPNLDKMKGVCFNVRIDVNGIKPPNKYGRDSFFLLAGPDGNLYPYASFAYSRYYMAGLYWRYQSLYCGTAGSTDIKNVMGAGCAARIMEEGWEMNY